MPLLVRLMNPQVEMADGMVSKVPDTVDDGGRILELKLPRFGGSSAICVDLVRSDVTGEGEGTRCKMEDERALFFSWVPHCGGDASRCGEPAHHSRERELRRSLPKLWPAKPGRAQPL